MNEEPKCHGPLYPLPPSRPLPQGDPTLAKHNFKKCAIVVCTALAAFGLGMLIWELLR